MDDNRKSREFLLLLTTMAMTTVMAMSVGVASAKAIVEEDGCDEGNIIVDEGNN
jgi:hypothetical protein